MNDEIIIIDSDRRELMRLVVAFRGTPYRVTAVESEHPIEAAMRMAPQQPAAIVLLLDGRENVVELRDLIDASSGARLLFLEPDMPPSAAIARIVRNAGGVVMSAAEPAIVIMATLITMLTHETAGQRGSA